MGDCVKVRNRTNDQDSQIGIDTVKRVLRVIEKEDVGKAEHLVWNSH